MVERLLAIEVLPEIFLIHVENLLANFMFDVVDV